MPSSQIPGTPFDSKIACLCQSIEINSSKHISRQSQVRKPTGSGVERAECSLITGMGCRVQVFAWSSIAQAIWCLRHWVRITAFSRGRQLGCAIASKLAAANMCTFLLQNCTLWDIGLTHYWICKMDLFLWYGASILWRHHESALSRYHESMLWRHHESSFLLYRYMTSLK